FFRSESCIRLKADSLCEGMYAWIRARACLQSDLFPGHPVQDLAYFVRDRPGKPILFRALPSEIAGPVVLYGESDILHDHFLISFARRVRTVIFCPILNDILRKVQIPRKRKSCYNHKVLSSTVTLSRNEDCAGRR